MTRRDLTAALMLGVVAAAGVYALTRVHWGVMPPLAVVPFLLGLLAGFRIGHGAGRAHQRGAHALRFWQGAPR